MCLWRPRNASKRHNVRMFNADAATAADSFSGRWKLQARGQAWAQYDKGDMLVWSNPSGIVAKSRIDG